jgi:hypothetical protein
MSRVRCFNSSASFKNDLHPDASDAEPVRNPMTMEYQLSHSFSLSLTTLTDIHSLFVNPLQPPPASTSFITFASNKPPSSSGGRPRRRRGSASWAVTAYPGCQPSLMQAVRLDLEPAGSRAHLPPLPRRATVLYSHLLGRAPICHLYQGVPQYYTATSPSPSPSPSLPPGLFLLIHPLPAQE